MSVGIFLMKIRFVLPDRETIKDSPYEIPHITKHPFTLKYLLYLKSLQFSESFLEAVKEIRLQNHIPEDGIPVSNYLNMLETYKNGNYSEILKEHKSGKNVLKDFKVSFEYKDRTYIPSLIFADIEKDLKKFYPVEFSDPLGGFPRSDIGMIALFNAVLLYDELQKMEAIFWYPQNFIEGPLPRINIGIFANVSKRQLLKYIEANFDKEIKPQLLRLPVLYENQLSEYELQVYELRFSNPRMTFREIADALGPKIGKPYLTEDNVKKTFHTAKSKLQKSPRVTTS